MQLSRTLLLLGCYFLALTFVTAAPADQEEPFFELPVHLIGFPIIIASVRIANFFKKLAYILSPDTYVSRVKRAHLSMHDEEILNIDQIEKKLVTEFGNNVCIYEKICVEYAERMLRRRSRQLDWNILDWGEVFRDAENISNRGYLNPLMSMAPNQSVNGRHMSWNRNKNDNVRDSILVYRFLKESTFKKRWLFFNDDEIFFLTHPFLKHIKEFPATVYALHPFVKLTQVQLEHKSSPNLMKENYLLSIFLGNIISSPKLCHSLAERGRACDNSTLSD